MHFNKRFFVASLSIALAAGMPCTAVGKFHSPANEKTEINGIITGRVVDSDHNALPGATVTIKGIKGVFTSDVNGNFKLPNLKSGTYEVTVSYVGFAPVSKTLRITEGSLDEEFVLRDVTTLSEVEVIGAFHGQRRAMQLQKQHMGITNVVSAIQMGKFPDQNIGDALKRISGINVQYDQGEPRFGQVRGTSADLSSVSVNGNRLPSAKDDTRNVQLDLIPADMIEGIEVNKVVTADMDGDAIGGAINLVTKNTPYRRVLNITAGTGGTLISGKPLLNLGGTWGKRFVNDRLGIMASASYQVTPAGSDNVQFSYVQGDEPGTVALKEAQVRQYYVTRERQSYSLSLDYKFSPLHKISFKGLFNRRNDWENRYRLSYKKLNEKAKKQSVVLQTKGGAGNSRDARKEISQTMDFTLDGEHDFGILETDWAVSFSRATEDRPDERYIGVKLSDGTDWASTFNDVGARHPYSTMAVPSTDNDGWKLDELTNTNQQVEEDEWKTRVNFKLPISKGNFGSTLRFGAKFVSKTKDFDISQLSYGKDFAPDWRSDLCNGIREGYYPGCQYPLHQPFISKGYLANLELPEAEGEHVLEEEAAAYNATERITAGFVRFDQKFSEKVSATIGLRVENTRLHTDGKIYTVDDEDNEQLEPTGEYHHYYTDILPSFLLKYAITPESNLRFSVTRTMSRPKYSAMIANRSYSLADRKGWIGDPDIDPSGAWNIDLSADNYFKGVGLVSAGIFYKDIHHVNVETESFYTGSELGLSKDYADEMFSMTQNINAYDARVLGVEVAYQRDFGFIHPALKSLGLYGNYTYTHSWTHNYNPRLGMAEGTEMPMAGNPAHTANLSLCFEKAGWKARVSYNYASSFIDKLNMECRDLDRYYDAAHHLDANASYTFGRKARLTVYGEATNLLTQPLRYYQGTVHRTMEAEYYGVRINAGIKLSL